MGGGSSPSVQDAELGGEAMLPASAASLQGFQLQCNHLPLPPAPVPNPPSASLQPWQRKRQYTEHSEHHTLK